MTRKNKLYKHHKSKAFFIVRNFSFAFLALVGVGASVAIPTYISTINNTQISTKADSSEAQENDNIESLETFEESNELETY